MIIIINIVAIVFAIVFVLLVLKFHFSLMKYDYMSSRRACKKRLLKLKTKLTRLLE